MINNLSRFVISTIILFFSFLFHISGTVIYHYEKHKNIFKIYALNISLNGEDI